MSNKVLSSNQIGSCGCGPESASSSPPVDFENPSIIVRNIDGALNGNVVRKYYENGKIVYQLEDFTLVKPVIAFSNNAAAAVEIGVNLASVQFNGSITQGSYPITLRSITPDPGGLDLTAPFNFTKTNVKRTSPGVAELHTVSATDDQANQTVVNSGVNFKHSFYQGFSDLASLSQAEIKALVNKTLNDNIIQQYGGAKTYVVPGSPAIPKYIYWVFPVGTQAIAGATMLGLGLALSTLPSVAVTNSNDGTIVTQYVVMRTANKFNPGSYAITIS
jgi:hypothetical protein